MILAVAVEQNILEKLILTAEERDSMESCTRQQSECDKWHNAHRLRITGSKSGRILLQKKRTVSLLQFCIYLKIMQHLPKPITWGINNEDKNGKKMVMMALKSLGQDLWYIQGNAGLELHQMHGLLIHL